MKKSNKSNPLKFFNDNKAMAYKKAGGEMAAFKKSLGGINNDPTKKEIRQEMRAINKMDRKDKRWNRKDERLQAKEEREKNKEAAKILMASKRF